MVYWFLFKTTIGFEIRAVGANPDGARYAGMNIVKNFVIAMTLSGALAGLAGATQVLGIDHWVGQGFSSGYGFDSIAIALLGQSHPLGVVLAAFLWGTLRSGATSMQSTGRCADRDHFHHPGPGDRLCGRAGRHPLDLPHPRHPHGNNRADTRLGQITVENVDL